MYQQSQYQFGGTPVSQICFIRLSLENVTLINGIPSRSANTSLSLDPLTHQI